MKRRDVLRTLCAVGGTTAAASKLDAQEQTAIVGERDALGVLVDTTKLADEELPLYYAAADVVVLPSSHRSESFGQVLLEAMAAGRAVVSTELGTGTSFVNLHGKTGMVVPTGDAKALAEAVNQLLGDPERRLQLGANGRRRVLEEFHIERMVDRTIDVYREALMAKGHHVAALETPPFR